MRWQEEWCSQHHTVIIRHASWYECFIRSVLEEPWTHAWYGLRRKTIMESPMAGEMAFLTLYIFCDARCFPEQGSYRFRYVVRDLLASTLLASPLILCRPFLKKYATACNRLKTLTESEFYNECRLWVQLIASLIRRYAGSWLNWTCGPMHLNRSITVNLVNVRPNVTSSPLHKIRCWSMINLRMEQFGIVSSWASLRMSCGQMSVLSSRLPEELLAIRLVSLD